ncbi:MAG: VOC family protein [Acidobacteriota bacterium]
MKARLISAYGYQGDAMNLACEDVDAAGSFYIEKMGFMAVEQDLRRGEPPNEDAIKRVVLERDGIRMALAENGGDPEQDGVAFHTDDVEELRDEFIANGLTNIGAIGDETRDNGKFRVFFVVAPDGLCYWFGQKQA